MSCSGMKDIVNVIFNKPDSKKEMVQKMSVETFSIRIKNILFWRKLVVSVKWKSFFDRLSNKMLSSPENYLFSVISACHIERSVTIKPFDSFINACALVMSLSEEILRKTGLNLIDLNPNIILVFYDEYLKKYFKKKGISEFEKHVGGKCHMWNWKDLIFYEDRITDPVFIEPELEENLIKEIKYLYHDSLKVPDNDPKPEVIWKFLALKILSNPSVELPVFPNKSDLNARLEEFRGKEIAREERKERVRAALTYRTCKNRPSLESSNPVSITNIVAKHLDFLEIFLAGDILLNTSVEHPALQNELEGEVTLGQKANEERVVAALIPALYGHSSSNSESTANNVAKQLEDSLNFEEIIQAVMRYNQSKDSVEEKASNQRYRKTEGILERFKTAMKSLSEFLDRFDTE